MEREFYYKAITGEIDINTSNDQDRRHDLPHNRSTWTVSLQT